MLVETEIGLETTLELTFGSIKIEIMGLWDAA